ncbi:MAG: hypothetical protein P4L63_01680 [Candidatus Pacebacteria bacterium]|nr:hypothetical protein [Candidatus Paceibacterota bacterium]
MKNTNHKSINLGLKTLTILAFAFIFVPFHIVAAQVYDASGGSGGYGAGGNVDSGVAAPITPYQPPIYTPPATTTPIVYSNDTNPNPVTPTTVVVHKKKATPVVATTSTCTTTNPTGTANNGLSANALFGSNSFLPSGLIQWILFAIFVLLIVILVRTVFGGKKKYQESPLKHE